MAEDLQGISMGIHTVFIVDLVDVLYHFLNVGFDVLPNLP